jgi:hypothetical protein
MKIGWFTHHIERDVKTSENASESLTGLFNGRFAGGAEMSDYEYKKCAPKDWEIITVTPDDFQNPADFDSVIVTGTDAFEDWQLFALSDYEPFVFVHHLQTQRPLVKELIDNSRMFVTHTPAHMLRELTWTNPKRTAQVLSHFDTSEISADKVKVNKAVWAARNHPLKGLNQARMWAAANDIELEAYSDVPRSEVLEAMEKSEWFVHLPIAFESECRAVMEAVLAGCKVHANPLVGITSVEDWHEPEVLKKMIDKAGDTFWRLVQV